MITIVCSSQNPDPEFKKKIIKNTGLTPKKVQFLHYENKGKYGLTELYNKALDEADNDIVVFLHHDIEVKKNNFGRRLIGHFKRNPEFGIVGIAGSSKLPTSCKWWENSKRMFGRVEHTKDNKTWLSAYSNSLGNQLQEVVLTDGVFFAVHKKRIKKRFNEDIKGFHFYDVSFTLDNHLAGVKVGVCTDILINHHSLGETDDEWEKSRKAICNFYQDVLPVKVDSDFDNRKLKILIGCLNFNGLTGSELSTMELARELVKNNCDVTVVSQVGGKFTQLAKRYGIKTAQINEPPGFKIGDGKWGLKTSKGTEISKPNMLYQVSNPGFDVIHANHTPITQRLLQLYPNIPTLNIVRSEVIGLENPIVHDNIKQYVAIRPTIKDHMIENFEITGDKIEVIYNLFDKSRFEHKSMDKGTDKEVTLFVGTMDYLREKTIRDIISGMDGAKEELWLVGKNTLGYASKLDEEYDFVKYFPPTENIEEFYYKCDKTAGIFIGRTTIEGFLCNKPGWVYIVDTNGGVVSKEFQEVPEDMSIFDNNKNVLRYIDLYKKVYNT